MSLLSVELGRDIGPASAPDTRPRYASSKRLICPPQNLSTVETARVDQRQSLNPTSIFIHMLPNTIAVEDRRGKWHRVTTEETPEGILVQAYKPDPQAEQVILTETPPTTDGKLHANKSRLADNILPEIDALRTVPKRPYVAEGGTHIVAFELGKENPVTIVDFPLDRLAPKFKEKAKLLQIMQKKGGSVAWGNNNSPFSLEGWNLQSVISPHDHMFEVGDLTVEEVRSQRNQRWDDGLSRTFGEEMIGGIHYRLREAGKTADINVDNMGVVLAFDKFTPGDMADMTFLDKFLQPLYGDVDLYMQGIHEQVFDSKYVDVKKIINNARQKGGLTEQMERDYQAKFAVKPEEPTESYEIREMKKWAKEGKFKSPPGVVVVALFTQEGQGILGITPGFINDLPLGPAEALGIHIVRQDEATNPGLDSATLKLQYQSLLPEIAA